MSVDRYDGPAVVVADGARFPVEARLRREPDGERWGGRLWTDDPAIDPDAVAAADILVVWVGGVGSAFVVERVLDHHMTVAGTGIPPF
ncbi:DUF4873 domain-containing protein [Streptomyces sp. SID3343]|uniref:DUF4873 domain-containing protein n=1 Tax=Streptomyces sp. SID3343 TaxID=2690260 RepID=UPI0013700B64|nr:DUF4873 domain-containing protein [Streptomyces sp. SID3343]MYW06274.1 DUF4873 domain-containing protein [Streptomyces sp. SID3343]